MLKKTKANEVQTLIGPNCVIEGKIQDLSSIQVDGKVAGDITTEGDVYVGKYGFIQGNIQGKNVYVYGKIDGNVTAEERIELCENSRVEGDLKTARLIVHEGAFFRGTSYMEDVQVASSVEKIFRGDGER
ncbi:MAG: polymer-forming cytoskeletal protein [bacterium]